MTLLTQNLCSVKRNSCIAPCFSVLQAGSAQTNLMLTNVIRNISRVMQHDRIYLPAVRVNVALSYIVHLLT